MHVSFIRNDKLLKEYNKIWHKVIHSIKKGFDSEPVHIDKNLKTKIKFCEDKIMQILMTMEYQKKVLIVFFISNID